MIGRRRLLTGGAILGAVLPAGAAAQSADAERSERQAREILQALKDIRTAIDAHNTPGAFTDISAVRSRLFEYLKLQGKFPDYMEVGSDIWLAAYDWHVKQQQPITLERDASGRYTLLLMATRLILRQEAAPNLLGTPFDSR